MEPATWTPRRRESADSGESLGPLFARPTASDRRRDLARLKERLEPVALELAQRRGAEGITASELVTEAIVRGVLLGDATTKSPRIYAWVGPWLAGLARGGALSAKMLQLAGGGSIPAERTSERDESHGNKNRVYLHPEVAG